jgi:hypothetical protein
MTTPKNTTEKFDEFKKKVKFVEEPYPLFYPGIMDESLRPIYTEKINQAANDFQEVANGSDPTEEKYHAAIDKGLARFNDVYLTLDTEDIDRVCWYFEELMDIVGLESSGGRLNKWRYWFDLKEE